MTRAVMPRVKAMGSPRQSRVPKTRPKTIIMDGSPPDSFHDFPKSRMFGIERAGGKFGIHVSYADKGTAGSHRKIRNPERETKRCGRLFVASIGLQDDPEPIHADNPTESQGQDPIENCQDAPDP